MAIRVLDCALMSPWFPRWHVGGTSLLVDTDKGSLLVDTRPGPHDYDAPIPKVRSLRLVFGGHRESALVEIFLPAYTPVDVTTLS